MSKTSARSGGRGSRHRADKALAKARLLNRQTDRTARKDVARQRDEFAGLVGVLEDELSALERSYLRVTKRVLTWLLAYQPAYKLAAEIGEILGIEPELKKIAVSRPKSFSARLFTFSLGRRARCTIEIWDGPAHVRVTRTDDAPPFLLTAPGNKLGGPEKVALAEYLEARMSLSV